MPEMVLLIEDDSAIRRFVSASLSDQGFKTLEAVTGKTGLEYLVSHKPDLVLLDLGLPDGSGMEVLRRIREWSRVPVIIISARGQEGDKVAGLDAGADDYLSKPFGAAELLARIRVSLRRFKTDGSDFPVFKTGDLKVDLSKRRVWIGKKEIHLSPIQYKILSVLVRDAGKVVTRERILEEAWGKDSDAGIDSVRIYMHQLRKKIEKTPLRPRYLKTELGVGYRMITDEERTLSI
jgi:two-component system KDP operon response regulator KdpE